MFLSIFNARVAGRSEIFKRTETRLRKFYLILVEIYQIFFERYSVNTVFF